MQASSIILTNEPTSGHIENEPTSGWFNGVITQNYEINLVHFVDREHNPIKHTLLPFLWMMNNFIFLSTFFILRSVVN